VPESPSTMDISTQDLLDPNLALAAAQARRQLLALGTPLPQAALPTQPPAATDTVSLTRVAQVVADSFNSLMQQVTSLPGPEQTTVQPATATPLVVQAINQAQELPSPLTADSATIGTVELPDALNGLLQQATLTPLASQLAGLQAAPEGPEQARDVTATTALSALGPFGNGQTSNPNSYTPAPGAESYAQMQKLLVPAIPTGSLDLLV